MLDYEILRIIWWLSLIHISEHTRPWLISYAVICLKKKNKNYKKSALSIYRDTYQNFPSSEKRTCNETGTLSK